MPNAKEIISIPSYNPADAQSETGLYEFLIDKALQKMEKVAPAKILKYDNKTNRAEVQILNLSITSTGEKLPQKPIPNVPVLMLSGGGFTMSFPMKKGDIGWLVAADRDISIFKQLLDMFTPNTYQKHRYKDSFFIPDKVNGFEISEDEQDAVLITSLDGTTKISLRDGQARITAPKTIINSADTAVNGNLSVSGTVTAGGDVTGANISLSTHIHGGVQTGSGTTGDPQ